MSRRMRPSRRPPQTLERIIDQELLVQKALNNKLDRDPNKLDRDPQVMQAIEDATRAYGTRGHPPPASLRTTLRTT
jgi:hypothetical protein